MGWMQRYNLGLEPGNAVGCSPFAVTDAAASGLTLLKLDIDFHKKPEIEEAVKEFPVSDLSLLIKKSLAGQILTVGQMAVIKHQRCLLRIHVRYMKTASCTSETDIVRGILTDSTVIAIARAFGSPIRLVGWVY
jgi:hypothetical protein